MTNASTGKPFTVAHAHAHAHAHDVFAQERQALAPNSQAEVLTRTDGSLLAVFTSVHVLHRFAERHPDILVDTC